MVRKNFFVQFLTIALLLASCARLNTQGVSTATPEVAPSAAPSQAPAPTSTPAPAVTGGTITLWHSWDDPLVPTLVQIIHDFQSQYPDIQFDVLYVPPDGLRTQFETAAREGGGPTILLGPASWGPGLYDEGLVTGLSDLADANLLGSLNQAALGSGYYQQTLISLPYTMRGVVLYRNQNIIPEAPKDFEEMVSLAKSATQGDVVGAVLERSFFFSAAHLYGIGGKLMETDGSPAFNDQKGVDWMNLLSSFDEVGPTEFMSDRDLDLFEAGKVGMVIDGTWNMKSLAEAIGTENLKIDPWPAYQQGHLSGFIQTDNVFLSSKASRESRAAAWKFMEYFLSPQAQLSLAEAGQIPVTNGVAVADPLMVQAITAMAGGTTYPVIPEISAYASPMDVALKSVFVDGVSPADALQSAYDTILKSVNEMHVTPTP